MKHSILKFNEFINESKIMSKNDIIEILKNNKLLCAYLRGEYIGKDNSELYKSLMEINLLKDKYPDILKPKSTIFYRTDVIEKTEQLDIEIEDNAISMIKDMPFIKTVSKLTPDLLKNKTYLPNNKLQGWTSDKDFVMEHWYNVYMMNQV